MLLKLMSYEDACNIAVERGYIKKGEPLSYTGPVDSLNWGGYTEGTLGYRFDHYRIADVEVPKFCVENSEKIDNLIKEIENEGICLFTEHFEKEEYDGKRYWKLAIIQYDGVVYCIEKVNRYGDVSSQPFDYKVVGKC